jgi:hypothetical protein
VKGDGRVRRMIKEIIERKWGEGRPTIWHLLALAMVRGVDSTNPPSIQLRGWLSEALS